jgi:hypothetical protein
LLPTKYQENLDIFGGNARNPGISFQINVSPLIVLVVGGSRIQGYGQELDIEGSTIDPDLPVAQQSNNISV